MKGLLKNNFFAACSNAKVFSVFMLVAGIFVVAILNPAILIGYVLFGIDGFSVIALAGLKREYLSKWGKYKLTLPLKRADIIKSHFISQLIWLTVGTFYAGAGVSLSWLLHGCPFDKSIDTLSVFALGISISLLTAALFFPLFYLGGEERGDVFLMISLLCGSGIAFIIISLLNFYLDPGLTAILLGDAVLFISSLLAFTFSYPLTVGIYSKKEY